ncbi:MAG: hypothetical protein M1832_002985 [Thelocarpon impressellum]|nr:MAG: hypothetical protein M1832_002985 [Thelocarpon impressellum]
MNRARLGITDTLDDLTERYAKDLEQAERVETLETAMEVLQLQHCERIQQLEDENVRSKRTGDENAKIRGDLEQERVDFHRRSQQQEEKLMERGRVMEQELIQKYERRTGDFEKKLSNLQTNKSRLQAEVQALKMNSKDLQKQWARESAMHHDRMEHLEQDLRDVEFAIQNKPNEFYVNEFRKVDKFIQELAEHYFGQSLEYNLVGR